MFLDFMFMYKFGFFYFGFVVSKYRVFFFEIYYKLDEIEFNV